MITRIDLYHFKCFSLLKLPLAPLTLLSGTNASGKSSVLQALAVLHQTIREHQWSTRLMLNGLTVRLGTVADVVDQVEGRTSLGIGLWDGEEEYQWNFEGGRTEMSMEVDRVRVRGKTLTSPTLMYQLLPILDQLLPAGPGGRSLTTRPGGRSLMTRLRGLSYLTAERLGPRDHYPLEDPQLTPVVGPAGEHAVSVLLSGEDSPVPEALALEGTPPTRLRQVEARMAGFFPGCQLTIEAIPHASAVRLGVRTSQDTRFHRPGHTGFGLTQVLPIVVAALSSESNGLLLIENPEVHLHPAGQANMGEFLAEVGASGVQVLLETHSDHVLNGVRRAVKEGKLQPEQVALHFFRPRADGGTQVESPSLDADGNIDVWPEGFFDQFDRDMNYFAGWS